MKKTAPATGTGWSVGLMVAIALFGVGSTAFVLRSSPDEAAEPRLPVVPVAETATPRAPAPAELTLASTPASAVAAATPGPQSSAASAPAPAAPATVASTVKPSAPPPVAPEPKRAASAVAEKQRITNKPEATPAARQAAPRVRPAEPVEQVEPMPVAKRPATLLPSTGAKVQVIDQQPAPVKTEKAAEGASAPDAGLEKPAAAKEKERAADAPKYITAEPLVKAPFKPFVVMATDSKVWIRASEQQTHIYDKGQKVPGFGVFKESDGKTVKFDSGSFPVNATE